MSILEWPGKGTRAIFIWLAFISLPYQAQTHLSLTPAREAVIGGAGLASVITGRFILPERTVDPLIFYDPHSVPGIDRYSLFRFEPGPALASDISLYAAVAASYAVSIFNQHGERPLVPVIMITESAFISSGMTTIVKHVVARPRPYLHGDFLTIEDKPLTDGLVSFWSGHTALTAATTFACANIVQRSDASKGLKTATWIGAAVLPATVGYFRIAAGRHFPTDVLTGYAFGALVGWAVPYFHRAERKPRPLVE